SSDSHILLLRLMDMAPKNSTILLNTKGVHAPTISELGYGLFDSLFLSVVQYGASSSPKSNLFTPNIDLVIPFPTAILAILQSITALVVARNPLPTSRGVSGTWFRQPIERYGTSPWTNVDLFLPSSKLSTYLSNMAL
ncbi:hypothetical protein Tco_1072922, partial [Tanacetum coccineum]